MKGKPRVSWQEAWTSDKQGRWSIPFRTRLSVAASDLMPVETAWYLVYEHISRDLKIFPAKVDGIATTFQHQSFNADDASTVPWRTGNPCLHRPAAVFGRPLWNGEPEGIDDRIVWHIDRLLTWIDAAASNELVIDGEHFELPSGPGQTSFPVIGFLGSENELDFWAGKAAEWGWADLARLPKALSTYVVKTFRDRDRKVILDLRWGSLINSLEPSNTAIWVALDGLPVLNPWVLPSTWASLRSLLTCVGIDLSTILVDAGADRRRRNDGRSVTLLLGFPLSVKIGDDSSRYHWIAVDGVGLSDRSTKKDGFRAVEKAWRLMDRSRASSASTLNWVRTVNWEPEEIRTRGACEGGHGSRRLLIIGAGAFGSAVSENLVRMGMTELGVSDADRLDMGNLTRHSLGMDAVGHNKATALANALNLIMPDANVAGFASSFPPEDPKTAEEFRAYDVVIDCTASDSVLDAMSCFEWGGEKLFVSLSMTWRAEGLLVFTASEASFPAVDARERFAEIDLPPTDLGDARMEGIGCWHPVFPASAADVRLWSAIGAKAILRAMENPGRSLEYFRQSQDGTVERVDG